MSARARPRRSGVRPTAGLVVEGETEFLALPKLTKMKIPLADCPPIKAINLGGVGSDVVPAAIAKRVLPKVIEHLAAGRAPVVVCLDREDRDVSAVRLAEEIAAALRPLLDEKKWSAEGVYVVSADRAFEAWLLADAPGLHARGKLRKKPTFHSFEGKVGKQSKKGVVELTELLGRDYRKTTDGPRLFEELDVVTARAHGRGGGGSRSFDAFLRCLGV